MICTAEYKYPGIIELWPHPLEIEGRAAAEDIVSAPDLRNALEEAENDRDEALQAFSELQETHEEMRGSLLEIKRELEPFGAMKNNTKAEMIEAIVAAVKALGALL